MSCIQWFKSLIANRDFESLKMEFRESAKKNGGYFMPKAPFYDFNDESVYYVDEEIGEQMKSKSFTYSSFIEERIKKEANEVMLHIAKTTRTLNENEKADFISTINNELTTLIFLNEKTEILDKREVLNVALRGIRDFIATHAPDKPEDTLREVYIGNNLFGFEGKASEVELLYNILETEEIDFFNPNNYQYQSFNEILTSTMIVNLQPITVSCDNYTAAYILRKIEPLFIRLDFSSIAISKVIYKRNNKPFTRGDLDKALSVFNTKAKIDDTLKKLIDKALYPLISKR